MNFVELLGEGYTVTMMHTKPACVIRRGCLAMVVPSDTVIQMCTDRKFLGEVRAKFDEFVPTGVCRAPNIDHVWFFVIDMIRDAQRNNGVTYYGSLHDKTINLREYPFEIPVDHLPFDRDIPNDVVCEKLSVFFNFEVVEPMTIVEIAPNDPEPRMSLRFRTQEDARDFLANHPPRVPEEFFSGIPVGGIVTAGTVQPRVLAS